jgi:hypothetical protein
VDQELTFERNSLLRSVGFFPRARSDKNAAAAVFSPTQEEDLKPDPEFPFTLRSLPIVLVKEWHGRR